MNYAVKCVQTGTVEFVGIWDKCQDYIKAANANKLTAWKVYGTQAA